jgi:hypothetical protein
MFVCRKDMYNAEFPSQLASRLEPSYNPTQSMVKTSTQNYVNGCDN